MENLLAKQISIAASFTLISLCKLLGRARVLNYSGMMHHYYIGYIVALFIQESNEKESKREKKKKEN